MSERGRRKTAQEVIAELEQDPAFLERELEHERHKAEAVAAYHDAAGPVLAELAEVGFPVEDVSDLHDEFRRTGRKYQPAIPVLLRWLPRITYPPLEMSVLSALSVPWAKREVARPLIERFRSLPPHVGPAQDPRWTVGEALERVVHPGVADELLEIAADRRYGQARQMVVLGLARLKRDSRVVPVLVRLLDDPDVTGSAIMALGKLKAASARGQLERFADHPEPFFRKEARKALAKIDK